MKKIAILSSSILLAGAFFVSCSGGGVAEPTAAEYALAEETVEQKEKKDPLMFLKSDGTFRVNLIGESVCEVTIANKATKIAYKDVVLKFTFFNKAGSAISSQDDTFYEDIQPNSSLSLKKKFSAPEGTETIRWNVVKAVVA